MFVNDINRVLTAYIYIRTDAQQKIHLEIHFKVEKLYVRFDKWRRQFQNASTIRATQLYMESKSIFGGGRRRRRRMVRRLEMTKDC